MEVGTARKYKWCITKHCLYTYIWYRTDYAYYWGPGHKLSDLTWASTLTMERTGLLCSQGMPSKWVHSWNKRQDLNYEFIFIMTALPAISFLFDCHVTVFTNRTFSDWLTEISFTCLNYAITMSLLQYMMKCNYFLMMAAHMLVGNQNIVIMPHLVSEPTNNAVM